MRRFLFLFLLIVLVPSAVSATEYRSAGGQYRLFVNTQTTSAEATVLFDSEQKTNNLVAFVCRTKVNDKQYDDCLNQEITATFTGGSKPQTKQFRLEPLLSSTTYYFGIGDLDFSTLNTSNSTKTFRMDSVAASITFNTDSYAPSAFKYEGSSLDFGAPEKGGMVISAKLKASFPVGYSQHNINGAGFFPRLYYSTNKDLVGELAISSDGKTILSDPNIQSIGAHKDATITATNGGINADGTYYYFLSNLNTSGTYWVREIVRLPGNSYGIGPIFSFDAERGYTPPNTEADQSLQDKKTYRLLAPLPGLSVILDPQECQLKKDELIKTGPDGVKKAKNMVCDINSLITFAIKFIIGVTAVALVLRLMFEGYQYMVSDVPMLKVEAKSQFFSALIGLVVALTAYLLLNTINPKLVTNTTNIASVALGISPKTYATLSATDFKNITGTPIKAKSELITLVKKVAAEESIDECLVAATIQSESSWREAALGADENYSGEDATSIPSRVAFIKSGIKYDGTAIPAGTTPTSKVVNNDGISTNSVSASKEGYGIDWRFSVGIGLMQLTLFPEGYSRNTDSYAAWAKGAGFEKRKIPPIGLGDNKKYSSLSTLADFFNPEKNIRAGVKEMKKLGASCMNDPERFLKAYNGGSCDSQNRFAIKQGAQRLATYKLCEANGL